jgi:hypothetical protein
MFGSRFSKTSLRPGRATGAELAILIAEYQFVSGLIPFYRRVEMAALAGTGLTLSAVAAALTALQATAKPSHSAEAVLLACAAWVPAFLLLIESVALARLSRASAYIEVVLQPIAFDLTGNPKLLAFEHHPSGPILDRTDRNGRRRGVMQFIMTSTPLILAMCFPSLVLGIGGIARDPRPLIVGIGGVACFFAVGVGRYAWWITHSHEQRTHRHRSLRRTKDQE